MLPVTLALVAAAMLVAWRDWRRGLFAFVAVAWLQDPLRKLVSGQPVYFIVLAAGVFAAAALSASRRFSLAPRRIAGWRRTLEGPAQLLFGLILLQAAHSFLLFLSPVTTALGLLNYLAPVPALMLGYRYAQQYGAPGITAWMTFYAIGTALMLSGLWFEYRGYPWAVLGQVGEGMIIHSRGLVLKTHAGFFRAAETAAWHAATVSCFVYVLATLRGLRPIPIVMALGGIAIIVALGLLTGRRKALVQVAVFLVLYHLLGHWAMRRGLEALVIALVMGALVYLGQDGLGLFEPGPDDAAGDPSEAYQDFLRRGRSGFGDASSRFDELGLGSVGWAIEQFGWLGIGVGPGSPGTNIAAIDPGISVGAAEGGLGKITMELGVPGLLLLGWFGWALLRHLIWVMRTVGRQSPAIARLASGLLAFLLANGATFVIATQVYGDVFILLVLGLSLGFLLAMPVIVPGGRTRPARASVGPR